MVKRRGPPSQGWRTFLRNHAPGIAAMDFFVVPTIGFKLLYAFVIVRLDRRDLAWINVTANPTAEWAARQITEAFPWNEGPRYMIRDRDRIYGGVVTRRLRAMGIRDKPIAPASPWQNGFAERLIGSIRRECLDHIIVFGEAHLRRILRSYADYNDIRTHRSLDKDAPVSRRVQRTGIIVSHPILGGLHRHYVRVELFGTQASFQGRPVACRHFQDDMLAGTTRHLFRSRSVLWRLLRERAQHAAGGLVDFLDITAPRVRFGENASPCGCFPNPARPAPRPRRRQRSSSRS